MIVLLCIIIADRRHDNYVCYAAQRIINVPLRAILVVLFLLSNQQKTQLVSSGTRFEGEFWISQNKVRLYNVFNINTTKLNF